MGAYNWEKGLEHKDWIKVPLPDNGDYIWNFTKKTWEPPKATNAEINQAVRNQIQTLWSANDHSDSLAKQINAMRAIATKSSAVLSKKFADTDKLLKKAKELKKNKELNIVDILDAKNWK